MEKKIIPYHVACQQRFENLGPDKSIVVEDGLEQLTQDGERLVQVFRFKGRSQFSGADGETKLFIRFQSKIAEDTFSELSFSISPEGARITCDLLNKLLNEQ